MRKLRILSFIFAMIFLIWVYPSAGQSSSWEQTKGPSGGHVHSLLASDTALFASVERSGLHRLIKGENKWERVFEHGWIASPFISPSGDLYIAEYAGKLYRSQDNGVIWNAVANNQIGEALAFMNDKIILGGWDGVYELQNDGTWSKISEGLNGGWVSHLVVDPGGRLYAGMGGMYRYGNMVGVYYSEDSGKNWKQVEALKEETITSLAASPWGTVFVGTRLREESGIPPRVFHSHSDGSWSSFVMWGDCSGSINKFAFGNSGQVFVAAGPVWRSDDDGDTWEPLQNPPHSLSVAMDSDGNLYAGNSGIGVYKYLGEQNGQHEWNPFNDGLVATEIRSLAFHPSGYLLAGGAASGISRGWDRGETWSEPWNPWPTISYDSIAVNSMGHVFAGPYFAYSLNGANWESPGVTGLPVVDHNDNLYLYRYGDYGVRKFTGSDLSNPTSYTTLANGLEEKEVTALAISRDGVIFAGTNMDQGGLWRLNSLEEETWQNIAGDESFKNDWIVSIAISPNGTIFLINSSSDYPKCGIWRSRDMGDTWKQVYQVSAQSLAVNAVGQVFVGAYGTGVHFSDNDGDAWKWFGPNEGVTNTFVNSFAFDKNGYAYAATWGGGVFRTTEPTYTFIPVSIDIKPGTYPNTINLGSHGVVPVAILSSESFDATMVDPVTVTLAGANVRLKGKGTPMVMKQDVNNDGRTDLVVHVETEALQLSLTSEEAILEGTTFDGRRIRGTDSIKIVP